MKAFLLVMVTVLALSCGSKLAWLATGTFPERKPSHEVWDVIIHFALIVWSAILLLTHNV